MAIYINSLANNFSWEIRGFLCQRVNQIAETFCEGYSARESGRKCHTPCPFCIGPTIKLAWHSQLAVANHGLQTNAAHRHACLVTVVVDADGKMAQAGDGHPQKTQGMRISRLL